MLETQQYARRPFHVQAVEVTPENMADVAAWTEGVIETSTDPHVGPGAQYVKINVRRPLSVRQTRAYVGDYVLFAGTGFKVYTAKAFAKSFEPTSTGTTVVETAADVTGPGTVVVGHLVVEEETGIHSDVAPVRPVV